MDGVEKVVAVIVGMVLAPLLVMFLFMCFAYLPVLVMAERECLAKGYPVTNVTVALERYCSTLDGAVSVRVERLK